MGIRRGTSVVSASLAAILALSVPTLGQDHGAFSFSSLVSPGQPSPDGGRFFSCRDCFGQIQGPQAFNASGLVGISAETDSTCFDGLFLVSGGTTNLLANFCSVTIVGKPSLLGGVAINQAGNIAVLTGPADSQGFIDPAILVYSGGLATVAAQSGDPTSGGRTDIGPLSKKCIFSEPFINNNGQVTFWGCTVDDAGMQHFGIFSASGGIVTVVASDGDPSPIPGNFTFVVFPSLDAINNDAGEILFQAGIAPPDLGEQFGLFLSSADGIQKIVESGDTFASGYTALLGALPAGMLNNNGDVAFCADLDVSAGGADSGIFLSSGGTIRKIVVQGDPSPIGGKFATFLDVSLDDMVLSGIERPELNSSGAIVFKAKAGPSGNTPALFMASPTAVVKIVAVGDVLPNGERIGEINTYALNEAGQVAFFAYRNKGELGPLGVWVASPVAPSIKSAKLKMKATGPVLMVKGSGFITNDSVIEINGKPVSAITYPAEFQQNGGTTTRLLSQDADLSQLLLAGHTVQITVVNSLTASTSSPFSFTP